jgi:hypothetical protein
MVTRSVDASWSAGNCLPDAESEAGRSERQPVGDGYVSMQRIGVMVCSVK